MRRLVGMGVNTTVVDDLSTGIRPEAWPQHLRVVPGDHCEFWYADIRDFMRERSADFDLIMHCAAVVGGRLTIDGDPLRVATDLAIDADFFNWVVKAPISTGQGHLL